jgi:hypothetical protein
MIYTNNKNSCVNIKMKTTTILCLRPIYKRTFRTAMKLSEKQVYNYCLIKFLNTTHSIYLQANKVNATWQIFYIYTLIR